MESTEKIFLLPQLSAYSNTCLYHEYLYMKKNKQLHLSVNEKPLLKLEDMLDSQQKAVLKHTTQLTIYSPGQR